MWHWSGEFDIFGLTVFLAFPFLITRGVLADYNRMDDDLEEELDAAEYEKFDDAEEESEEEE